MMNPDLIMHIGGHKGQDGTHYRILTRNDQRVIWAEPNQTNADHIRRKFPNQQVLAKVIWSKKNETVVFYETKNSQKSSVKKPLENLLKTVINKTSLITTTIDEEMPEYSKKCLLVVDVQGGEIEVLKGAKESFPRIKWIVLEITSKGIEYENVSTEDSLDRFLEMYGFVKSFSRSSHNGEYKDQLYIHAGIFRIQYYLYVDYIHIFVRKFVHFVKFGHHLTSTWHCSRC